MKKLIACLIAIPIVFAFVAFGIEKKQYGSTNPGEMYFIKWQSMPTNEVWVNNEAEMWQAQKLMVHFSTAQAATTTLDRVMIITEYHYQGNVVSTNPSGTVTTNYSTVVTNITYNYLTNRICAVTNIVDSCYGESEYQNCYFQKGDYIVWGGNTNVTKWIGIVGYR